MAKKNSPSPYPQFNDLNINIKHQHFVYWYCHPDIGYNATRAYAKAYGYDGIDNYAGCAVNASKLLNNTNILDAVDIERNRRIHKHEEVATFVMNEWKKLATADITDVIDISGDVVTVKEISKIPQHLRSCIKSIKATSNGFEVTFYDKNKALENLAKTLGMFVEKTQNVNDAYESLVEKIERKRRELKNNAE